MILGENKAKVVSILKRDRIKNALLIRTIETDSGCEVHMYHDSCAVYQSVTGYYLLSLTDRKCFLPLAEMLCHSLKILMLNDISYIGEIESEFPDAKRTEYIQYSIESEKYKRHGETEDIPVEITSIDKSWIDFILGLYKNPEFAYREYIERCVDENPCFGAVYNGKRVGFVLVHMDGEIGPMVIADQFRGRGIGGALMRKITPIYSAQASVGAGFVVPDNKVSCKMMERAGFVKSPKNCCWIYL